MENSNKKTKAENQKLNSQINASATKNNFGLSIEYQNEDVKDIFNQLQNKSLPLLQRFSEDLTKHDKEALKNYKGSFIHITRETGTTLIKLKKYNCREEQESAQYFFNYYLNERKAILIQFFNGKILKEVTAEKARQEAQKYFEQPIENIIIKVQERCGFSYVIPTETNSFNEAKKVFLPFYKRGQTISAISQNGINFI